MIIEHIRITCTSSSTYTQILNKIRFLPTSHKILDVIYDSIWSILDEFHYKKEHLLNSYNYIICNIHSLIHYIELVGILSLLHCNYHHMMDLSRITHMHTNCTLFLFADMCCMGTNLFLYYFFTCDEWYACWSVFALHVGNWLWNWNGLVLGEICDIIWTGCSLFGWWFQDFRWGNEGIFEMSLSLCEEGGNTFIFSSLAENWGHPIIKLIIKYVVVYPISINHELIN